MSRRTPWTIAALALGVLLVALIVSQLGSAVHRRALPLSEASVIRKQAAAKHLDPALIAAVIYAESKFNARDSSTGAKGLMQIQPATAKFIARRSGGMPTPGYRTSLREPRSGASSVSWPDASRSSCGC